ncbi:MAG: hypothetical protein JW395_1396 [Nitrospira sp.]|nr:hypothetical protein [Nitrospira sp.]
MDERQGLWGFKICNGIADIEPFDAHYCAKIAGKYLCHLPFPHSFKNVQLLYTLLLYNTISLHQGDRLVFFYGSPGYLSYGNTAKE